MTLRFMHYASFKAVLLVGMFLAIAANLHAQIPVADMAANTANSRSTSPSVTNSRSVPATDLSYVIGADDVLAIDVWHEQELSRVIPVRPDGKISLPLLGEMKASGQTPLQLQSTIAQHLKEYVENPQVTVIVQEAKSQSFNVIGEVAKPGAYVFGHPVTVLDAVALAGGFRDFAKTKKMYVLRTMADGSQHKLPVNYKELVKGKDPAENIVLQSRDTVVVP